VSDGAKARVLLGKLAADGEREALATVARAREEAERITQESARRLAAALARAKADRLAQLAERESGARLQATAAARRAGLEARRALVARVLAIASSRLGAAATAEWLAAEVERALAYLPDGAARVRCPPDDVRAVRQLAAARHDTTVVADDSVRAGVIAELADGSLVVDASAGSRLDRMRDALAIEIIAAMERGA
jgi:vacuolar-type H+-ATPase subunit E/Vma4